MAKDLVNNGFKGGPLPDGCPPTDAAEPPAGTLLRLVATNPCSADDFKSGHAEGRRKPNSCDACTWLACSFYVATTLREKLAGLAKLPNLRNKKFVAHVKVTAAAGKIKPHKRDKEHLSFWMRDSFSPEQAVVKIEPLE